MALVLYTITAAALLFLAHRVIRPLSKPAAVILFLIPFVFTGWALLTNDVYGPIDLPYATQPLNHMKEQYGIGALHNAALSDLYGQMIPWRKAVQYSLARGEWPLWNPFLLSGDILAGSGQSAPYSPFTLLALLLPVPIGLTFSAALTHFLAALGAFLLAREIGCRESASLLAAAGWSCATALTFFILWPLGGAWSLLPFVLLGVRRASIALLASAFTLLLLAGHPETALHIVAIAGVYALVQRNRRVILNGIVSGLIALGLSAIFILPILEAAPQTMEHVTRTGQFAETPRGVATQEVLRRFATDAFPYLHARNGTPLDSSAAGSIILALALYAIGRVRTRESWFFAGIAVFGIVAHAEWTPLARVLQQIPLFDQALNERFSFAAACALCMLAALAIEDVLHRENGRAAAITAILVLIAITIGNAMIDETPREWGTYAKLAEIGGLAVASFFTWRRMPHVILGVLLLQRAFTEGGIYQSFDAKAAYPPIPILEKVEGGRITGHGRAFLPGTAALYELEDVRGYQAMTFRRYRETYDAWCVHQPVWFNRVDDLTRPFLSFLNVRYAITWDRDPPPDGWREAARQPGTLLLENTRVLDRIFVPRAVRLGFNAIEELPRETDFAERAYIEAALPPQERVNGPGSVTFTRKGISEYDIAASMQGDGWIVASHPNWKGWRAYVDGRRVETQFANHAFIGVFVPKGEHRVRLVYLSDAFVRGRAITIATLLGHFRRRPRAAATTLT
jgi:hypothetical protein